MADELSTPPFIPENTGGIIKIFLNNAAKLAKKTLQEVDKTGVLTSQLTEDDLIEIGTGIQEKDTDKIKNVISFNLEKIQANIPEAALMSAGINLARPEMLAANITNNLIQTGGAAAQSLSEWDIGDNIISKGTEGIFDIADIAMNAPNYGIATLSGDIMNLANKQNYDLIGRPLNWAGQKIYDYTSPFFNFLRSPFQTKTKGIDILPEILSQNLQQTNNIPIGGINQPNVITNDDGTQTLTGGTSDPSDDITVTNLPSQGPTMADVTGPSTLTNNDINQIISDQIQLTGGGGNTGPRPRPSHHFAQGGLVSMAHVLRR